MALLETRDLAKYFGGLHAVDGLDLEIREGEILGLIGPNGAGKSTVFNMLGGFFRPTRGTITFNGEDITGLRADQVARRGIGRTFQSSTLFMEESVLENVFSGFHMHYTTASWKAFLHTRSAVREDRGMKTRALEILEFMDMLYLKDELAFNLPHGYQRVLGVCVALAGEPRLLLLDEPLTGMNPTEKVDMMEKIRQLRARDITIAIVEHDMKAVMSVCERIVAVSYGQKLAEGRPQEIQENQQVIEAYLGKPRERKHVL
jgi:branched-chain amino acid transport system ATP-binding protein